MDEVHEYATCDDCGWTGEPDELVDNSGDGKYDQCARCGSTKLTWDEE